MRVTRGLIWIAFWTFVIISWAAAGFYFFIAGWNSCESTGSCSTDMAVGLLTLLLMPAQVLLAVWLKHRQNEERG